VQRAQMQQPDRQDAGVTIVETDDLPVLVRQPKFFDRKIVRQALPWVVIAGMFVLWELCVRIFQIQQLCCRRRRRSSRRCGNGARQSWRIRGKR